MIIDARDPRDIDIATLSPGSRNRIKASLKTVLSGLGIEMRDDRERDRDDRERDSLDDTRSRSQSPVPNNDSEFRANDRRVQIPQWLLLFLVLQGASIIWWAATTTSDLRYQEREKIRIEQKLDTVEGSLSGEIKVYDLQRQKDLDGIRALVRDEVANQLLSRGVVRIGPSNP